MNPTSERPPSPRIWGVAALVQATADLLQARFGTVRVQGELSACTAATSGHHYFSLKDTQGQAALLRCAMFRRSAAQLGFALREGLKVEAVGRLAVYEPRGDLQFIVESVSLVGAGSLYEEFLRLKARLSAEGWFDPQRKRSLPRHPRRIGVVSSLGAAALRDVLTGLARRAPHVQAIVYPCLVQGEAAPASIVSALALVADRSEVEVVIVARGGGSLEDLWAFNDERVVRAMAQCPIPVVCGVGHETDVTLADFAADVRAATPTAAAELCTPVAAEEWAALGQVARRLGLSVHRWLDRHQQNLDHLGMQVLKPAQWLGRHALELERLQGRLQWALREPVRQSQLALERRARRLISAQAAALERARRRREDLTLRLQAQDPQQVLQRGYAWLSDSSGKPITRAIDVSPGDAVTAVWQDGQAQVRVESVSPGLSPLGPASG